VKDHVCFECGKSFISVNVYFLFCDVSIITLLVKSLNHIYSDALTMELLWGLNVINLVCAKSQLFSIYIMV